ncbi:polysaccharide deacetylase family protein [Candidatus Desulfofervidus auxilii]|uniref:NodB homology domain-containing protein n=2 Tax=Desulfofervidus auxilii TaxID=1621989 RepID=A0A7V1I3P5_DESA2|nr:polysaccharide deacetylase family protein [Candidatus Desulfofervidus auxilii]HEB73831.1 hypothetical protein [Candidatus Desulfofervidus auxilii]
MATIQKIKTIIRKSIAFPIYKSSIPRFFHRGQVLILMYHRVLSDNETIEPWLQPGMYVKESVFKMHLKFLLSYSQVISFSEFLKRWSENDWDKNGRYSIITFDDGWKDNYIYAFPVLKRYNLPATIFLTTNYIGTNKWFWPEKIGYLFWKKENDITAEQIDKIIGVIKRFSEKEIETFIGTLQEEFGISLPKKRLLLNWEEIKEMSKYNISFGFHTANHRILTRLSQKEIINEINPPSTLKETNFVPVFSYPNGEYNLEVENLLKEMGFEAAVTTKKGWIKPGKDSLFSLKRTGIHQDISFTPSLFNFHISIK